MPNINGSATGPEYINKSNHCPYCKSKSIEGGADNVFEASSMISNGCKCNDCGKRWAESYTLSGWIELSEGGKTFHKDTRQLEEVESLKAINDKLHFALETVLTGLKSASAGFDDGNFDYEIAIGTTALQKKE